MKGNKLYNFVYFLCYDGVKLVASHFCLDTVMNLWYRGN